MAGSWAHVLRQKLLQLRSENLVCSGPPPHTPDCLSDLVIVPEPLTKRDDSEKCPGMKSRLGQHVIGRGACAP